MSRGIVFGTYYANKSVIHALDPRTKFLGALCATIIGFCAFTPVSLAVLCLFTLICYALAGVPAKTALHAVLPLSFIVIITVILNLLFVRGGEELFVLGPLCITEQGVHNAVFYGIRLSVFLFIMCLFTLTTTTIDIADSFEKLLAPFKRIGVPAREVSLMMGIALGFMPQFSREFSVIRQAQRCRGSKLASAPKHRMTSLTALLVPLFSSVFRHADTLSRAMDARCYRGGIGRTRVTPMEFSKNDAIAAVVILALCAAVVTGNFVSFVW